MELEWAENRLAEFKLWAGGVGAFASDRASLDARLAVEWETKSLVTSILILLRACIERCWSYGIEEDNDGRVSPDLNESPPTSDTSQTSDEPEENSELMPRAFSPWSDSSTTDSESHDDTDQETPELGNLGAAKSEVEQIIDHLIRLGVAIRKSGTSSRSQKADRFFKESDHQDFLRYLTVIVLGRGTEEGREQFEIDPKSLNPVQERLVMANLRRRNRFLYAQRHAKKLESRTSYTTENQFGYPVYDNPVLIDPTVSIRRPVEIPEEQLLPNTSVSLPIPIAMTATSASKVGSNIMEVPQHTPALSQIAKTDITTIAAKVHSSTIMEDQYASLVTAASRPAPAGISQCPLCDETGTADCEPLLNHIAEHVHSFSLCSLPWPGHEGHDREGHEDDYFKTNLYFEEDSNIGSDQYNIFSESDRDSKGPGSLPSNKSVSHHSMENVDHETDLTESVAPKQGLAADPSHFLSHTFPEAVSDPTPCPEGVMLKSYPLWPPVSGPPQAWINYFAKPASSMPASYISLEEQNRRQRAIRPWDSLPPLPWEEERDDYTLDSISETTQPEHRTPVLTTEEQSTYISDQPIGRPSRIRRFYRRLTGRR
ncbi:transcription factor C2H2 [Fusarium heterosporum]|uniref:Transcription factor C2H2 n=1 Tax=Fusarium heterosporum TaxID=42747 RepID=A0A8H5WM66_FUSHE|nr:transcription factor C2H2 [Fusarium heterosporum]